MKKTPEIIETPIYNPDDLVPIYCKKNKCGYRWGIPYKNFKKLKKLKKPYSIEQLVSLEGKILNIFIFDRYSIKFPSSITGVKRLDVGIMSSESEDRQLLHKISTKLRTKTKHSNRNNIPRTNYDE